jgi:hypothetical protein
MNPGKHNRILLLLFIIIAPAHLFAGPPYETDDPDPTDYKHYEIYLSAFDSKTYSTWTGNPPLLEFNYGGAPNLQLSATIPMSVYAPEKGPTNYGIGDIELGAKYRFIQEDSNCPQVAFYPQMNVPTGNASKELGAGRVQVFLPVWIQKSFGKWQTYGGGGYWINSGPGNLNYAFIGWQAQYQFAKKANIGAELYYVTPDRVGTQSTLNFNVGTIIDFNDISHFVCAVGRSIYGSMSLQIYVGYLFTI